MIFFDISSYNLLGDMMNQTYTVKSGDTLYGISNQFGVSVNELIELNNVQPGSLQIGQVLKIPVTGGTNPDTTFTYTVKKGDSLYSIANIYDTTVQDIINLNNLKSNNIFIGQTLLLPEKYNTIDSLPEYVNYVVKKGDSLYSIAKAYGTSVDLIMKDNALNNINLSIGQNLKIRTNKKSEVIEECFGVDYIPSTTIQTESYTVKKGDNLYSIARNYNTTVNDIIKLNNLTSNSLPIGQVLKIPISNQFVNMYVVKKGDSLYSIAKKLNTTVDNIKSKNNLSSNNLSIGQVLKI